MPSIAAVRLWRYELPLRQALQVRRGAEVRTIRVRAGLVLGVELDDGRVGFGEAAPLEGLHGETLENCAEELKGFQRRGVGMRVLEKGELEAPFWGVLELSERFSGPVMMAIEQALFGFWAEGQGRVLLRTARLGGAEGAGPGVAKIKVNGQDRRDVERVIALLRAPPSGWRFRVDANLSFDKEGFQWFEEAVLKCEALQYVEEPLAGIREAGLPIALDESLFDTEPEAFSGLRGVTDLVLKPSRLGGLAKTCRWVRRARELGLGCSLSSAYESGLGILGYGVLARELGIENEVMGYGTYRYLAEDILVQPLPLADGRLSAEIWTEGVRVDFKRMEAVL